MENTKDIIANISLKGRHPNNLLDFEVEGDVKEFIVKEVLGKETTESNMEKLELLYPGNKEMVAFFEGVFVGKVVDIQFYE